MDKATAYEIFSEEAVLDIADLLTLLVIVRGDHDSLVVGEYVYSTPWLKAKDDLDEDFILAEAFFTLLMQEVYPETTSDIHRALEYLGIVRAFVTALGENQLCNQAPIFKALVEAEEFKENHHTFLQLCGSLCNHMWV